MIDDFVAFVVFDKPPQIRVAAIETMINIIEPGQKCSVVPEGDGLNMTMGAVTGKLSFLTKPMPEEAVVSSIGMADLTDDVRDKLLAHRAHAMILCDSEKSSVPMEKMIFLLKCGMALCESHGGEALAIPACGLCLRKDVVQNLLSLNQTGSRAWGIDESESEMSAYDKLTLWDSLRNEAVPADIIIGFVPAAIGGKHWFFSAGHSLFNLPELAYCADDLQDYIVIRDYFRTLFRIYYQKPHAMQEGRVVWINDSLKLTLQKLPDCYKDFEATTGTFLVHVDETFSTEQDWD